MNCDYECVFDRLKEAKKRASDSFSSKRSCPPSPKPLKPSICSQKSQNSHKSKCSRTSSCEKVDRKSSQKCSSVNFKECPTPKSNCSSRERIFIELEGTAVSNDNKNENELQKWSKTMTEIKAVSEPCSNFCQQQDMKRPAELPCKQNQKHVHCVTRERFPCCDDDESPFASDDDDGEMCERKRKVRRGFPCCCAKKNDESSLNIRAHSSMGSICPENAKKCQTEADDFKKAQIYYRKALENEKKRQKLYSRRARMTSRCANMKSHQNSKLSEKDRAKLEEKYRKAKAQYRQRRKKMEEKARKSLEKELKKSKVEC